MEKDKIRKFIQSVKNKDTTQAKKSLFDTLKEKIKNRINSYLDEQQER